MGHLYFLLCIFHIFPKKMENVFTLLLEDAIYEGVKSTYHHKYASAAAVLPGHACMNIAGV